MTAFDGKWTLAGAENTEAFHNAVHTTEEYKGKLKQIAEAVKTNPQAYIEELSVNKAANTAHRNVYIMGEKKRDSGDVKMGAEYDGTIPDGRPAKLKITLESDTKLVINENGADFSVVVTMQVAGNDLTVTQVGGGVTAIQRFKRV